MAGLPYDASEAESRWQARWDRDPPAPAPGGEPFYNLAEFPYPSAEGLHVGHVLTNCGVDVVGRYQRMRGRVVFQPIGFDSFGIHTENYALKVGDHPGALTERTIANYRRQLSRVGCAWDWTGVVTSHRAGIRTGRPACCPSTCMPAAQSTSPATTCTPASSPWPCTTWALSASRSRSCACGCTAPSPGTGPR